MPNLDISTIIVAVISLVGTLGGTFAGILTSAKLSNYRIEQLEKKVEKHNGVIERTFILEGECKLLHEHVDVLEKSVHELMMEE